jgi:membrane protease YdiL (CAAX protease family)
MKKVFKNNLGDYRTIWKVLFALFILKAFNFVSDVIVGLIYPFSTNWGSALGMGISVFSLYFVYYLISKKNIGFWNKIGFNKNMSFSLTIIGFFCGAVAVALYITPLLLTGQLNIIFRPITLNIFNILLLRLIYYSGVSFAEEITFRGYIQSSINLKNEFWNIIISALIFGIIHLMNSNYLFYSLIYLIIGGFMFGLMRIVTEGIWFPIGFHLAWNWTEGVLFGLNNDDPSGSWFHTTVVSESIWTANPGSSGLADVFLISLCVIILLVKLRNMKKMHDKSKNYYA